MSSVLVCTQQNTLNFAMLVGFAKLFEAYKPVLFVDSRDLLAMTTGIQTNYFTPCAYTWDIYNEYDKGQSITIIITRYITKLYNVIVVHVPISCCYLIPVLCIVKYSIPTFQAIPHQSLSDLPRRY